MEAIEKWPVQETVTDVRSFLGFTNHYRRFISRYTHLARPLNKLTAGEDEHRKMQKIIWTEECDRAFRELKHTCTSNPILAYADYKLPFRLFSNACSLGLG